MVRPSLAKASSTRTRQSLKRSQNREILTEFDPEAQWLDYSPPPELSQVTFDCPREVIDIVLRSLEASEYVKVRTESPDRECVACWRTLVLGQFITLKCEHDYCLDCFERMIEVNIRDEGHFPPNCCLQEVPSETIWLNLKEDLCKKYDLKSQEYAAPVTDRWYCPNTNCALWIPSQCLHKGSETQVCPHCQQAICTVCRGPSHREQKDCPHSFGFPDDARIQSCVRCYKCHAVIERIREGLGINCMCKAELCYNCGASYEKCQCTSTMHQAEIKQKRGEQKQQSGEKSRITEIDHRMKRFGSDLRRIFQDQNRKLTKRHNEQGKQWSKNAKQQLSQGSGGFRVLRSGLRLTIKEENVSVKGNDISQADLARIERTWMEKVKMKREEILNEMRAELTQSHEIVSKLP